MSSFERMLRYFDMLLALRFCDDKCMEIPILFADISLILTFYLIDFEYIEAHCALTEDRELEKEGKTLKMNYRIRDR